MGPDNFALNLQEGTTAESESPKVTVFNSVDICLVGLGKTNTELLHCTPIEMEVAQVKLFITVHHCWTDLPLEEHSIGP